MISGRLLERIRKEGVPYEVLRHRAAFTARGVAETTHVPARLLAKPVVVREPDGSCFMAVVNAEELVDLGAIARGLGRSKGHLAGEAELAQLFPDCEVGAMPPAGRLYGMPTYLDQGFRRNPVIFFQAGNHAELVRMKLDDFEKVAGPFTGEFSMHRETVKVDG